MATSDPDINRNVRQVLTRNWYDLSKTNFASRQGILRVMGELRKLGRETIDEVTPAKLGQLEVEMRRVKGVHRIHFDLANWHRNEDGDWVPIEQKQGTRKHSTADDADDGHESADFGLID